ncbi:unnamed protein product, partial [Porites evermanni]
AKTNEQNNRYDSFETRHFDEGKPCGEPPSCATADLSKSTRLVTATVLNSHRNQIVHFESLLEIEMVAGT